MRLPPTLLLAALLGLSQCKKNDPDPLSQLPPATQTGANTFGCLVNGQPWTPQGYNGFSNYQVDFDPTYRKGILIIHVYRYDNTITAFQSMIIGGDSIRQAGKYEFNSYTYSAEFSDTGRSSGCQEYSSFQNATCEGVLEVTRMDRSAGIVSGTFEFTVAKAGCDTIKVTQGRFDKKL